MSSFTILPTVTAGAIVTVATFADLPEDPQTGWIRYVIDEDRSYTYDGSAWDAGSGDVLGPASSTDNAVARFDGTGGTSLQNSVVTIADSSGDTAGVGTLGLSGPITDASMTADRAVVTNGSKAHVSSATTATEIGYVSGVTSAIQTQLNAKQASGSYITGLTGDVTAAGPGSVAATVAAVGGSTAAAVGTATVLANAAVSANTNDAIVKRDGSGNFAAGTITAALTGNVTGNVSGSSGSTTGNAATVTTNANLTGPVTSSGNATAIADGAIAVAKLAATTAGYIPVGAVTTGIPTYVAVSGDIGLSSTGVASISSGVIVNDDISGSAAIVGSKIVAATTSTFGVVKSPNSQVTVVGGAVVPVGSTGNRVRCFLAAGATTVGTGITYASDAVNGDKFTVNETGVYSLSWSDCRGGSAGPEHFGFSVNGVATTSITSLAAANVLMNMNHPVAATGTLFNVAGTFILTAADVVRPHCTGSLDATTYVRFAITQVARL